MKHGRVVDVGLLDRHPAAGEDPEPLDNYPLAVAEKRRDLPGRIVGKLRTSYKRDVMEKGAGFRILRLNAVAFGTGSLDQQIGKRERRSCNHQTQGIEALQNLCGNSGQVRITT